MFGRELNPILALLEQAAAAAPAGELTFYGEGKEKPIALTYSSLLEKARNNAQLLLQKQTVAKGDVVLLHFGSQAENVMWFWSLAAAGAIPAVSTPLAADATARSQHLEHLKELLQLRTALTSVDRKGELAALGDVCVLDVASLETATPRPPGVDEHGHDQRTEVHPDLAFLMLTSGSTGRAKAVEIRYTQLLEALQGKIQAMDVSAKDVFVNWIGFDHVACVTEVHLHAMAVGAAQVHVPPTLAIRQPALWVEAMSMHRATYSFAPNFFLAAVCKDFGTDDDDDMARRDALPDLKALRVVVTGGEANTVATGEAFNRLMHRLGAPATVLVPAFGMTETCAGSIYHDDFPAVERAAGLDFCAVGRPTAALQIRITAGDGDDAGRELPRGTKGQLELRGPAVVRGYFGAAGAKAMRHSLTADGWFRTGDTGFVDGGGHLVLSGRTKDSLIINGVKYFSHELEAAIEDQAGPGLVPACTSAFATWPAGAASEDVVVTFRAADDIADHVLADTVAAIAKASLMYCSKKPVAMIPLPDGQLNKSALGKLSRAALKTAYEAGKFNAYASATAARLAAHRAATRTAPQTATEKTIAAVFAAEFDLATAEVGLDDSLVHMGVDSLRLLRYKKAVAEALQLPGGLDTGTMLAHPSVRGLAAALAPHEDGQGEAVEKYNPVVVLQAGRRAVPPIWFFHPGLGEVLVFLNVSGYFADRRVYALRAPGFNEGEAEFESFDHMTDTYKAAILQHQPAGPFVLIGYSYGSVVAFETAKKLEAVGHGVGFLGSLNGPPHIKWRMKQIDQSEMILSLAYFLGFLTEAEANAKTDEFRKYPRDVVLQKILAPVAPSRLRELDLTPAKLTRWADIATALQRLARDYDPSGTVASMDAFYARPLLAVGGDRETWRRDHIRPWEEFARTAEQGGGGVRYHACPGAHYTMLDPDHVFETQKVLRAALKGRGML